MAGCASHRKRIGARNFGTTQVKATRASAIGGPWFGEWIVRQVRYATYRLGHSGLLDCRQSDNKVDFESLRRHSSVY
jgi:hypothetical protein